VPKIEHFDRRTAIKTRDTLQDVLDAVSSAMGITITLGSGTFSDDGYTFDINKIAIKIDNKGVKSAQRIKEEQALRFKARYKVGDIIQMNSNSRYIEKLHGDKYIVIGWNTKAGKYPLVVLKYDTKKAMRLVYEPEWFDIVGHDDEYNEGQPTNNSVEVTQ
jgi:hypothetical protein